MLVVACFGRGLLEEKLHDALGGDILEVDRELLIGEAVLWILDHEVRGERALRFLFNRLAQGIQRLFEGRLVELKIGNDHGSKFRLATFCRDASRVNFQLSETVDCRGVLRGQLGGAGIEIPGGRRVAGVLRCLCFEVEHLRLLGRGLGICLGDGKTDDCE